MKHPNNFSNKIIQGDCLEIMKEMEPNSIDTIITDPPYDLSTVKRFKAKDSGEKWNVKSGVYHRSSKGFMGKEWDGTRIAFKKETWQEMLRIAKPGATLLSFGGTRTYHRMACAIEDAGWILKDCIMWLYGSGFPKATDISKQLDKKAGKERKVVGRNPNSREKCDKSNTLYESGTVGKTDLVTEPSTSEAKLWNGWKSHGLKPAYEPIIVAMKSNEGSYAQNALKHGVAGLNIDGGRIGTKEMGGGTMPKLVGSNNFADRQGLERTKYNTETIGRFPSNILLDEEAAKMLDEQSGSVEGDSRISKSTYDKGIWGNAKPIESQALYNDKGGASRFFYVAKASRAERNMGCDKLEDKLAGQSMKDDKYTREHMGNTPANKREPTKNNHPTVKPIKLMEYLCILTKTPTGGIVLDPFVGSGTTGIACKKIGRSFIGIEKDPEYCKIAEARIKATQQPLL